MTKPKQTEIFWQAHRGGGSYEMPDNTMVANLYTWNLGGIPEADVRASADGVMFCFHDPRPARTTTVADTDKDRPFNTFTADEIRTWDAGVKFDPKYSGEKVPTVEEVFAAMQGRPERLMYLDLKNVDLVELGDLIDRYGVNKQCLFAHNNQDNCLRMKSIADGVRTMLWIMGNREHIGDKYSQARKTGFQGLDQVQIHFMMKEEGGDWPFIVERDDLKQIQAETSAAGIDLEIFLHSCEERVIRLLLDEGIRWFATDEPAKFLHGVRMWLS
jgi:glycerophosphoryl diester phosphodiesterase